MFRLRTLATMTMALTGLLASSTACTLIGAGIGSNVPRYEPSPTAPMMLKRDTAVRVTVERAPPSWPDVVYGNVVDVDSRTLWLNTTHGVHAIPLTTVSGISVSDGTRVWTGVAVGAPIDVIAGSLLALLLLEPFPAK